MPFGRALDAASPVGFSRFIGRVRLAAMPGPMAGISPAPDGPLPLLAPLLAGELWLMYLSVMIWVTYAGGWFR